MTRSSDQAAHHRSRGVGRNDSGKRMTKKEREDEKLRDIAAVVTPCIDDGPHDNGGGMCSKCGLWMNNDGV